MKMMKLAALALLAVSSSAFAASNLGGPITQYVFSRLDTVHEQFACTINGANDTDMVYAKNHAEMISDFSQGTGIFNVSQINSYYFDAYHDVDYKDIGSVVFQVSSEGNADITCEPYDATKGSRVLAPGGYGLK
jgi:hypothetical protein